MKILLLTEKVFRMCSVKKVFLEILQNSQENTCARVSFLICNFIKKETLAQVFSCEFCEISKNTFYTEHLRATAFGESNNNLFSELLLHFHGESTVYAKLILHFYGFSNTIF